jgi:hypothetical protein
MYLHLMQLSVTTKVIALTPVATDGLVHKGEISGQQQWPCHDMTDQIGHPHPAFLGKIHVGATHTSTLAQKQYF